MCVRVCVRERKGQKSNVRFVVLELAWVPDEVKQAATRNTHSGVRMPAFGAEH